jgi:PAS domain S-box-containing protein
MTTRTLRVLHVEDSERDVALLTRHLTRAGYELVSKRVDTAEALRTALQNEKWDVILCDYSMPHFDALLALAVRKELARDLPFIIISGTIGEELAVEAMRAGAQDYLMKDKLARLAPTIERELLEAENRRARRQAEEALKNSEAELRALFEAMTDVILVIDSEGRQLKIAPTRASSLYLPSADRVGKKVTEIFPPETANLFLEYVRRALGEGRTQHLEYKLSIFGQDTWFEGTVSPMTSDSVIWVGRDITERKLAEQQSRIQAAALESAANAIVITDNKGVISWINTAFTELTGYAFEEVIGKKTNLLKSGLHDEDFYQTLWDTILSGQVWHGEITNVRKDGSIYVEEQTITPVRNESGEIINFIGIKQEITERKRAEEEKTQLITQLESQRQRLDNIVSSVPGAVWETWREPDAASQRLDFVSDYIETMLGYTVEEWLSTPNFWFSIIHPDDQEATAAAVASDLAKGRTNNSREFRWIGKDGRVVWVQSNSAVISDNQGKPAGTRGVTIDITNRKRAEQAVRKAEEKYRGIFENAVEGIFQSTPEGKFISVNPSMARFLGYDSAEELMEHRTDIATQHYVDKNSRVELQRMLAEHGVVVGYECEVYRKNLSKIWAVENVRAIRDENGSILYYEGSIEDITERKTLENQLRQSQKLEAVGILAGGVAHDFNNLLTVISGYSDLTLLKLHEDDPLYRNVLEVKRAGERAAGLTRQLLAFSRKQVLQPKVLLLNSVISELEKLLRRLIGEDIGLRAVLDPDLGSVKADPGQIEQIIMNLAVNARDAMPKGGKLTIETKNVVLDEEYSRNHISVSPGHYVMLAVTDTGTGMDSETQARIFEPFFTTKEAGKGTGLGLSTVYGIVKQSGGNIWVYSELGRGTTFKIYLPRVDEGAQEPRPNFAMARSAQGSETVLLAEDEEAVRKLALQVLQMNGYQVLEAANGGAALLICERQKEPIHLLITDVIMPEMSGRELADRLAKLRPEMKVLFMSGYTDNAIVHQGVLDAGANFIQKPFPTDALARKVREVLDAPGKSV